MGFLGVWVLTTYSFFRTYSLGKTPSLVPLAPSLLQTPYVTDHRISLRLGPPELSLGRGLTTFFVPKAVRHNRNFLGRKYGFPPFTNRRKGLPYRTSATFKKFHIKNYHIEVLSLCSGISGKTCGISFNARGSL